MLAAATATTSDPATWEPCGDCGQTKRVNARAADGTARCPNCYRKSAQPKLPCDRCGKLAHPVVRAGGRGGHAESLGACCYRGENWLCGGCGRTRRVRVKATATSPDLCGTCHQAAITACTRCGTVTRCRGTATARQPICFRCHLADRLDELLVQPDGAVLPALQPIRAAVLSVDNPATGLSWLGRSRGATLLAQLASGQLPLTHDALDRQPPGFSVEHLRRMLVAAGALPERNEHLARLEAFAHRTAEAIDNPEDRRLLRSYATWHVIHRIRNDRPRPAIWPASGYRARYEIGAAARLLTDLRQQGRSLDALRQPDVDACLAGRDTLRSFLTWAKNRRIIIGIQLPKQQSGQPLHFADDQHRWDLARTLLHDDAAATITTASLACWCCSTPNQSRASSALPPATSAPPTASPCSTSAPTLSNSRHRWPTSLLAFPNGGPPAWPATSTPTGGCFPADNPTAPQTPPL